MAPLQEAVDGLVPGIVLIDRGHSDGDAREAEDALAEAANRRFRGASAEVAADRAGHRHYLAV